MRRRRLLAALAALPVAGCSRSDADAGSTGTAEPLTRTASTDSEPETTETAGPGDAGRDPDAFPEDPPDWSQVTVAETTPRTYALSSQHYRTQDGAAVRFGFVATATPDHPARLVFLLRNASDVGNTFRLDETPPFGRGGSIGRGPRGSDDESLRDAGYRTDLVLAPTADHDVVRRVPDYELADDGTWRLAAPKREVWLPERLRLGPGEWIRGEYVLLGRPEGTRYGRPTGRYDFSWRDGGFGLTVWDAESPGPEGESRFAGASVPPLRESVGWFHEADAATTTYVRPSAERISLPGRVDFEFVNHSRGRVECGHWNLYKLHDGEWFHVAPRIHTSDCRVLPPGATKSFPLRAFHGAAVPCDDEGLDAGHLGGGRYAMVAGYGDETDATAALVEIDAAPASVEPTADVTAERDGATVTVTSPRYGDGEHPPDATVTATRVDAAETVRLVEQVMQSGGFAGGLRGIRNTVPFFESGVERVVLRTDDHAADGVVGHESTTRRLRIDGTAYEFAVERAGESN